VFKFFNKNNKNIKNLKISINDYNKIIIEGTIYGNRYRLSTKTTANLITILWYKYKAEETFFKLYQRRILYKTYELTKFSIYGRKIIENTYINRNQFTQRDIIKKFEVLCQTFGHMQLSQIKASDILIWQNQTGLQPKTIINYRSVLNVIFKYAIYDNLITHNPLSVVPVPKDEYKEVEFFTESEVEILLNHTQGQLHNIILFVTFCGLRAGELIALKWSDIDFENNTILIQRRRRSGVEDVPKSKRKRLIDMLPQAKKALLEQKHLTYQKSEYIFISKFHKPYSRGSKITNAIKRVCRETGIKEGGLQTLRRTCNTLYKQYGLHNDWILHQLGHMSDEVNQKHYTGKIKPDISAISKVLAD